MKSSIILIISTMFVLNCNATNIPLDSIKSIMVSFYKESEGYKDVAADNFSDFMILDGIRGAIEEGKEGVFAFSMFIAHERSHYVLVGKDSVQILNMNDPIDQNIMKLTLFLERNKKYSKEDALRYIQGVITVYQRDEEMLDRFRKQGYVL